MEKLVIVMLFFSIMLFGCDKNKTTEIKENNVSKSQKEQQINPERNPTKALQQADFWGKKYYKLEYNPLYGYCYQHLFPTVDTSQEKDVIAFHVKSVDFDPMVIFIVDKIIYENNQFQLTGRINDEKNTAYIKFMDDKTINIILDKYNINESFDTASGISYSSFSNSKETKQRPVFDLEAYDTCEEMDKKIISDISNKLTDEKVKEQSGADVTTPEGYHCWGKWSNVNDMKNIYYELDKTKMKFKDYTDYLFSSGSIRTIDIHQMVYKNGVFYNFSIEDNELIGYMCLPVDNNTSMWVFDDINLGIFERIN